MSIEDIINTSGVSLILLAFVLLQMEKLKSTDFWYNFINLLGGGLACLGSWMIQAIPFVVLEGVWSFVALLGIMKSKKR